MIVNSLQAGIDAWLEGITKALKDGATLIAKLKVRLPPSSKVQLLLLQRNIRRALEDLDKEREAGVDRFDRAFELGDARAAVALQHITIQLQSAFLTQLLAAVFEQRGDADHDADVAVPKIDLAALVEATELCRTRANAALLEFRQRLQQQQQQQASRASSFDFHPLTQQSSESSAGSLGPATRDSSVSGVEIPTDFASPITELSRSNTEAVLPYVKEIAQPQVQGMVRTWTRPDFTQDASGDEGSASATEDRPHRGKLPFAIFKGHLHRSHSRHRSVPPPKHATAATAAADEPPRTQTSSPASPGSSPSIATTTPPSKRHSAQQQPSIEIFDYQTDNLSNIWAKSDPIHPGVERHDTGVAPDVHEIAPPQPSSPVLSHRSNSNSHAPTTILTPTPENDYLGYCKGAWKLQTGDRKHSFNKCREAEAWSRHAPVASSGLSYLACAQPRCAFRSSVGHAHVEQIWAKLFVDRARGIKYRWSFLAKSHVAQRVVVRQEYAFQCMFCTFLGSSAGQKGEVYHGIACYLEHIAKVHRGAPLNDVVLHRTSCINDHEASEEEPFDINMLPLSLKEAQARARADLHLANEGAMPASIAVTPGCDGKDAVLNPGTPCWSEGLSDFKPHSEMDRGEM